MRAAERVTDCMVSCAWKRGLATSRGAQHSPVLLTALAFRPEVARRSYRVGYNMSAYNNNGGNSATSTGYEPRGARKGWQPVLHGTEKSEMKHGSRSRWIHPQAEQAPATRRPAYINRSTRSSAIIWKNSTKAQNLALTRYRGKPPEHLGFGIRSTGSTHAASTKQVRGG